MKQFWFIAGFLFISSCYSGKILVRDVTLNKTSIPINQNGISLKLEFWNRVRTAINFNKKKSSRSPRGKKILQVKSLPYISVFRFTFSVRKDGSLLTGIDLGRSSIVFNKNRKKHSLYIPDTFKRDFPPKFYRSLIYNALFIGQLHKNKTPVPMTIYPSFLIKKGETVSGFLVVPRISYQVKQLELQLQINTYPDPWKKQTRLIKIPLRMTLKHIKL